MLSPEDYQKLVEAYQKASFYLMCYHTHQMSIEQLRYRLVRLVKQVSKSAEIEQDSIALVHQSLDEYHSDPVIFKANLDIDTEVPNGVSILNLFNPGDDPGNIG